MNVLVLNGSPKAKSDTMRLTRSFLEGLTSETPADVAIVDVIKKNLRPCTGCFGCWARGDGKCVIHDDQNDILAAYTQADVIIWSFPLYCYGMPGHLKTVLDRTIPLVQLRMVEIDGRVQHVPLVDFSKKRTLIISGAGFPDWEGNFEALRMHCKQCFGNLTTVFVPETPLLNIPEAAPLADPLLEKFRSAGAEYARTLALSPDTVAALEMPMMPKEDYLRGVNAK